MKRDSFGVLFFIRKNLLLKNGEAPVCMRITVNGQRDEVLPKSRMGQAIAYSYSIWPRMKNYLKDGRLLIDNNLAENAIRPIALSRKNFLFCGNHQAAENTAIICSLLASCKEVRVNPREWLKDILAKLPYYLKPGAKKDLKELLPNHWNVPESNII
jgi:hypothetical protein